MVLVFLPGVALGLSRSAALGLDWNGDDISFFLGMAG